MKNETLWHVFCVSMDRLRVMVSLTKALQEAKSKQVDTVLGEMLFYGLKAD